MSLQLHYTGQDYINRGLAGGTLTPGSTSAIVGGCKTGKGFAFDGTVNSALSVLMPAEPTVHSFSCWFRITDITKTRFITTFGQASFIQFMLWQRISGEFVFGYCNNTGSQINIPLNSNLPRGVWYHFAASINGLEMKLYLNGSLIKTHTAMSIRKGSDKFLKLGSGTTTNYLLGQICNFKYYNHVLSQKEIREDYKSLILHYPLKNENEISPYIALNKVETFLSQSGGFTQTQISKYHLHIIGSWSGTTTATWPNLRKAWNQYVDGNTYTITFTYRLNSYSNLVYVELRHARWTNDFQSSGRRFYRMNQFPLGEWFTVTLTRKFDSTDPSSINPLNPHVEIYTEQITNNQPSNVDLEIKDVYVTEGESILPYPTTNTGAILDVSGFQRHITNLTNNTVTLDSNSQVYSASLKNDGTQALVGTSDLTDLNGITEISISFRVYKQNTDIGAILTNRTVKGKGIAIFILSTQIYVDISQRNHHTYAIPLNEWVNICVTQSATKQKLYANGVLVSTMTAPTLTGIGNYTSISIGSANGTIVVPANNLNGNVQDIRFYATALTEQDVKDLYNVRHSIDKNGNYYTYELIEGETGVGMTRNGQTKCDEFIEESGEFRMKNNTIIKANNFKEI